MSARKTPTDQQLETAILWLQNNEGDEHEAGACRAVADLIEQWRSDELLRLTARRAGVRVSDLRRRLAKNARSM